MASRTRRRLRIWSAITKTSGHSGKVVRIASVAALGGLLFGYDSAVINGAVTPIQEHFDIDNVRLGSPSPSALLGAAVGAMIAGRIADKIGRISVMKIAAVFFLISAIRHGLGARCLDVRGSSGSSAVSASAWPRLSRRPISPRRRRRAFAAGWVRCSSWRSCRASSCRSRSTTCWQTLAGGSQRRAVARAGGLALDVPGDGSARHCLRLARVHHSRVAALSRCRHMIPEARKVLSTLLGREEPRNHDHTHPGVPEVARRRRPGPT